jgi:hypothetical protein
VSWYIRFAWKTRIVFARPVRRKDEVGSAQKLHWHQFNEQQLRSASIQFPNETKIFDVGI